MTPPAQTDHSLLDHPHVLAFLFHPRPGYGPAPGNVREVPIPVAEDAVIACRFHLTSSTAVNMLFFHGNGEIVDDYDEMGPLFNRFSINLLAADYRGYGDSTGIPTTSAMLADAHTIFHYTGNWLREHGYNGPLVVMGRSLGSAPTLELANHYPEHITGIIIESGFAYTLPLLQLIGIDTDSLRITERDGVRNLDKIGTFTRPTLIIHAEQDHIIPFGDGQALYEASPAVDKRLLRIPFANHNNIFAVGAAEYLNAVATFVAKFR